MLQTGEKTVTLQVREGQTARIPLTANLSESLPMVDGQNRGVTAVGRVIYVVEVQGLSDPGNLSVEPVDEMAADEVSHYDANLWTYGDVDYGYTFAGDSGQEFTERFDVIFEE